VILCSPLYSLALGFRLKLCLLDMKTLTDSVMTVKEVAEYLRVNQRTVYRLAVDRKLPGFKVGTTWRFKRADIERWIDAQASVGQPESADGRGQSADKKGKSS